MFVRGKWTFGVQTHPKVERIPTTGVCIHAGGVGDVMEVGFGLRSGMGGHAGADEQEKARFCVCVRYGHVGT